MENPNKQMMHHPFGWNKRLLNTKLEKNRFSFDLIVKTSHKIEVACIYSNGIWNLNGIWKKRRVVSVRAC